ncbi:MAG: hypothetical protein OHK0052_13770 [Anaerolineales bacterium]
MSYMTYSPNWSKFPLREPHPSHFNRVALRAAVTHAINTHTAGASKHSPLLLIWQTLFNAWDDLPPEGNWHTLFRLAAQQLAALGDLAGADGYRATLENLAAQWERGTLTAQTIAVWLHVFTEEETQTPRLPLGARSLANRVLRLLGGGAAARETAERFGVGNLLETGISLLENPQTARADAALALLLSRSPLNQPPHAKDAQIAVAALLRAASKQHRGETA